MYIWIPGLFSSKNLQCKLEQERERMLKRNIKNRDRERERVPHITYTITGTNEKQTVREIKMLFYLKKVSSEIWSPKMLICLIKLKFSSITFSLFFFSPSCFFCTLSFIWTQSSGLVFSSQDLQKENKNLKSIQIIKLEFKSYQNFGKHTYVGKFKDQILIIEM